jgi:hypothetical protein
MQPLLVVAGDYFMHSIIWRWLKEALYNLAMVKREVQKLQMPRHLVNKLCVMECNIFGSSEWNFMSPFWHQEF